MIDSIINVGRRGAFLSAKKWIIFYKSENGLSKTNAHILSENNENFDVYRMAVTAPMLLPHNINFLAPNLAYTYSITALRSNF